MDAVFFELQVQIRVSETAGAPMLLDDNFAWHRRELSPELATPSAILKCFVRPRCLLNGRNVLPSLVIAWTVSMMHCKENPQLRLPRGIKDLLHVRNAVVRFGNSFDAGPDLAAFGNEVVVRVDHQQRGDALVVWRGIHGVPSYCRWTLTTPLS